MSEFWFCVKHHTVEQGEDMCPPIDRLGPFDTQEEAAHALDKAEQRNDQWVAATVPDRVDQQLPVAEL